MVKMISSVVVFWRQAFSLIPLFSLKKCPSIENEYTGTGLRTELQKRKTGRATRFWRVSPGMKILSDPRYLWRVQWSY